MIGCLANTQVRQLKEGYRTGIKKLKFTHVIEEIIGSED
jgi:hypothetical protein